MTGFDVASAAVRFGLYVGLLFLFGVLAFRLLLAAGRLADHIATVLSPWMLPAATLVLLALGMSLPLLAANIESDWSGSYDLATLTGLLAIPDIGGIWLARINLAGLLLVWLCFQPARPHGPFAVAALLLASFALTGHAMMQDGAIGWLHVLNHAVHVLAAGFWLGLLPPLLVALRALRERTYRMEAVMALRRFSRFGHVAVAFVAATGALNVWFILGHWPLDWSLLYQELLAAKIALVALMIGVALLNRYIYTPRLKSDQEAALRGIARGTILEMALGVVVLALVAVFGLLEPM